MAHERNLLKFKAFQLNYYIFFVSYDTVPVCILNLLQLSDKTKW